MPQQRNWVAREKKPHLALRAELLGGQECFVDKRGDSHCTHDHHGPVEPYLDFEDAYTEARGWTAQMTP